MIATGYGVKITLLVPAFIGGLIALYFYDGKKLEDGTIEPPTTKGKIGVVGLGTALGLYIAPLVVDGFGLADSKGRLEIGFAVLIAALGMAVLAAVQRALRETSWGKAIESWITRR